MSRLDPSPLPISSWAEELSAGEAEIFARMWGGAESDAHGEPYLAHVARVAAASPADARAVAWLHDTLERTDLREQDLLLAGLSDDQLRALRLLTRHTPPGHDQAYLGHVGFIARAAGRAGRMARSVKRADLRDHITHERQLPHRWAPPYRRALGLLDRVGAPD
ncbi:MAG: hypothetical protein V7607_2191 [Solirubrobacteraceae bacterium]